MAILKIVCWITIFIIKYGFYDKRKEYHNCDASFNMLQIKHYSLGFKCHIKMTNHSIITGSYLGLLFTAEKVLLKVVD